METFLVTKIETAFQYLGCNWNIPTGTADTNQQSENIYQVHLDLGEYGRRVLSVKPKTFVAAITAILALYSTSLHAAQKVKPSRVSNTEQVFELSFCSTSALQLTLPLQYSVSVDSSADFKVYSIRATTEPTSAATLDIDISHNLDIGPLISATQQHATVAGHKIVWNSWAEEKNGKSVHHREALLKDIFFDVGNPSSCEEDIRVVFYASGTNEEEVVQMTDRISTLKIRRGGKR